MGNSNCLESSRKYPLPVNINNPNMRNIIIKSWSKENILASDNCSSQNTPSSTLNSDLIEKAANLINEYFIEKQIKNICVLELFAGNCCASLITHNTLQNLLDTIQTPNWRCTDIVNYNNLPNLPTNIIFDELHCVDAVARYGPNANVLLLISPPPHSAPRDNKKNDGDLGYGDYYACHDFITQTLELETFVTKYIIFVGELGASDGSEGIYLYLTIHKNLNLLERAMLDEGEDPFGGPIEKELFIFEIHV